MSWVGLTWVGPLRPRLVRVAAERIATHLRIFDAEMGAGKTRKCEGEECLDCHVGGLLLGRWEG